VDGCLALDGPGVLERGEVHVRRMRIEVANRMCRSAEAAPIAAVLPELRQAGARHGPAPVDITIIAVVARVVVYSGPVDALPKAELTLKQEASLLAILVEVP